MLVPVIYDDNACFCPHSAEGASIIRKIISSAEKLTSLRPGIISLIIVQGINEYIAYTLDEFKANIVWPQNEYGGGEIDIRLGRKWSPVEIVAKCPAPVAVSIWKGEAQ